MNIQVQYKPTEYFLLIDGIDCQHEQTEYEEFVQDYMGFDGHNQHEWTELVCQVCGDTLERDEPDYED